jgi:kinesin family protein 14
MLCLFICRHSAPSSWEEKLQLTKKMQEESIRSMEAHGVARDMRKIDNRRPNLVNLNEDPQLSEMLIYILKEGMFCMLFT